MAAKPTRNALGSHGIDSGQRLRVVRVPWAGRVDGRDGVEAVGSGQLAEEGPGGNDDRSIGMSEVHRIEGQVDDHLDAKCRRTSRSHLRLMVSTDTWISCARAE
jgi:hypothetical protein